MTDKIDEFVYQDAGNHGDGNNDGSRSTKCPKFISFSVDDWSDHFEQLITTLKMIHINFYNMKDEIDEFVSRYSGNHGNSNGSRSTRRFKFISFSVNNRSGHCEQLITTKKMIQVNMNNT